ncbi:MAG: permease-like cell division protein FtsX [Oscillospiraceae bacterium]|jgi:cell division transport system permease protein|nr:permease-like cell division protein FtsX [Oscillospiraceae bacterium]
MKIGSVNYLINEGFENVWRNKIMAFASFCVLLVSILLVGFSFLFAININGIIGDIEDKNEIAVYLGDIDSNNEFVPADYADIAIIEGQLLNMDNIESITFYSKEQAFLDMKNQLRSNGEDNVDVLFSEIENENPLPDAYRVKLTDVNKMSQTVANISALPHVYKVNSPNTFANVLVELRKIVTFISIGVMAAMTLISLVIISNSAKVSVYARRNEINIMKYVGATNAFIRLPFFVEGLVIGLLAGFSASVITWFTYDYIISAISNEQTVLLIIQNGLVPFESIAFPVAIAYVAIGALIGSMGTALSVRKHLDV